MISDVPETSSLCLMEAEQDDQIEMSAFRLTGPRWAAGKVVG